MHTKSFTYKSAEINTEKKTKNKATKSYNILENVRRDIDKVNCYAQ